ncbi:MAG: hypothetical protein IPM13_18975 [Phycisphaerales bacterium]|nr:hypothetical protein [Phycisphaerales bacterium]
MQPRHLAVALVLPSLVCQALLAPLRAQDVERAALATAVAAGRWSPTVERAYADYAVARARQRCGERVGAELWAWLDAHPRVRDVVVWATVVEPGPKVFVCLDRLRRAHGDAVATLPDLAVGFALAWSAGEDDEPRRAWESWTRGRSPIPTMEASFAWYAEHAHRLVFPIRSASWQVLAYTALNDVPLDERAWVLKRYRGKRPADLRSVLGRCRTSAGGLDGSPGPSPT